MSKDTQSNNPAEQNPNHAPFSLFQLRGLDLFCLHVYSVILLQLLSHWGTYSCGFHMTIPLFIIYLLYVSRILLQQFRRFNLKNTDRHQQVQPSQKKFIFPLKYLRFFLLFTEVGLFSINIYMIVVIAGHQPQFVHDLCGSRDIMVLIVIVNFFIILKEIFYFYKRRAIRKRKQVQRIEHPQQV